MKQFTSAVLLFCSICLLLSSCSESSSLANFSKRKYLKKSPKQKAVEQVILPELEPYAGIELPIEAYIQKEIIDSNCIINPCNNIKVLDNYKTYLYCSHHKCLVTDCEGPKVFVKQSDGSIGSRGYCKMHDWGINDNPCVINRCINNKVIKGDTIYSYCSHHKCLATDCAEKKVFVKQSDGSIESRGYCKKHNYKFRKKQETKNIAKLDSNSKTGKRKSSKEKREISAANKKHEKENKSWSHVRTISIISMIIGLFGGILIAASVVGLAGLIAGGFIFLLGVLVIPSWYQLKNGWDFWDASWIGLFIIALGAAVAASLIIFGLAYLAVEFLGPQI